MQKFSQEFREFSLPTLLFCLRNRRNRKHCQSGRAKCLRLILHQGKGHKKHCKRTVVNNMNSIGNTKSTFNYCNRNL